MLGAAALVGMVGLTSCRTEPKKLTVSIVHAGPGRPWDIAFTPGGSMIWTERGGAIRIRTKSGIVRTLATVGDVVTGWEGGLLGLAVDPHYNDNRRIYTCLMSNISGNVDIRVARWRVNNASDALGSRTDIVTGIPVNQDGVQGRHAGCRPRFGPDGYIWMGTGDAATGTVPQDPTSLGGKVLRFDTNGVGAPGNAKPPMDPRIYDWGHRNVQGIAFSPEGKAYSVEHGTDRDDEINRLHPNTNYGWDPVTSPSDSTYDESQPMTDLSKFPNAHVAEWSSGFPTIAPSGATFLTGKQWAGWQSCLAVAVLKAKQLRVMCFDKAGAKVTDQFVKVTDRGRLRVAVEGPDGNLYVAVDNDPGTIVKITPSN
jgi:glucose/arabinose dehydrogenase